MKCKGFWKLGMGFLFFILSPAWAQTGLQSAELNSPQKTLEVFLDAMSDYRKGVSLGDAALEARLDDATRTLDLSGVPFVLRMEKGREAAKLLKEILDRVHVYRASDFPKGGDLPKSWRIPDTDLVLQKIESGEREGEYLFSSDTILRLNSYYQRVKNLPYLSGAGKGAFYEEPWLEKMVPSWMKQRVFLMPTWKWIGLLIVIFLSWVLYEFVFRVTRMGLKRLEQWENLSWFRRLVHLLGRPLGLCAALLFGLLSLYLLNFEGWIFKVLSYMIQVSFSVVIAWGLFQLTEVVGWYLKKMAKDRQIPGLDDQLIPFILKSLKVVTFIFGVLLVIQNMGYNVMSIMAGLGLGGLAFALAAKDTAANLFGSIMILLDRPFKVGDWISMGTDEGMVEDIGFRSTRIRTFYDSVICVPNSVVANAQIDNKGKRKFRRVKAHFGITYDTPPEKIEAFLEGIKNIVYANSRVRREKLNIVFNEFAPASLDIMLYCFLDVDNWTDELVQRQNIFLEVLRLAKDLGIEFAFPTQTIHVESMPGTPAKSKEEKKEADLKSTVQSYGPGGARSRPGGLGFFEHPPILK